MRIGLVRHFKVKQALPGKICISLPELLQWLEAYETAEVEVGKTDLGGIDWSVCYSSTMSRAVATAKTIYSGPIHFTDRLREVSLPKLKVTLRLPILIWAIWFKLLWSFQYRTRPGAMDEVKGRISDLLDEMMSKQDENVLIVCHAALMIFLRKELLDRGFAGPKFRTPANGRLYMFVRKM